MPLRFVYVSVGEVSAFFDIVLDDDDVYFFLGDFPIDAALKI